MSALAVWLALATWVASPSNAEQSDTGAAPATLTSVAVGIRATGFVSPHVRRGVLYDGELGLELGTQWNLPLHGRAQGLSDLVLTRVFVEIGSLGARADQGVQAVQLGSRAVRTGLELALGHAWRVGGRDGPAWLFRPALTWTNEVRTMAESARVGSADAPALSRIYAQYFQSIGAEVAVTHRRWQLRVASGATYDVMATQPVYGFLNIAAAWVFDLTQQHTQTDEQR